MGGNSSTMDDPNDKPDEDAEEMKCASCESYLSCSPIQIQKDGSSICGRCSKKEGTTNIKLEAILKNKKFPCRFKLKGCARTVKFDQAVLHENICRYRVFACPSISPCPTVWEGSACEMCKHFSNKHADEYLKLPQFELKLGSNCAKNMVFKKDDETVVIIQYNYVSSISKLYLGVAYFPFDITKNIYYNPQFSGYNAELYINFKNELCKPFSHAFDIPNLVTYNLKDCLSTLINPELITIKIIFK